MKTEEDIRQALVTALEPLGTVVQEVTLSRAVLDVALFSDEFHGYEIKSDYDNLARLPNQIKTYSRVCATVTVVAGDKCVEKLLQRTPDWVGVVRAFGNPTRLKTIRVSQPNPERCPTKSLGLLWVNELKSIIKATGFRGYSRWNSRQLLQQATELYPGDRAYPVILETLKNREWKWWK